jgi:hypothetical protein
MLISEISKEHKLKIDKLEKDFDERIQEYVETEKILKHNLEMLQNHSTELEKDRNNEKTLR